ncbi:MAG: choline-sulfatase, partial [Planctomycetota bacterium]
AVINRPLFLFVHFYDPHEPYSSPAEDSERFVEADMRPRKVDVAHYDAEIRYVDRELGRLLDNLNQLRTERPLLIALTADHGQAFWERGWSGHNAFTYDEELRIPLIIKGPGSTPKTVLSEPVHTIDIVPTLLGLLGIDDFESENRRGLNLAAHMAGGYTAELLNRPLLLHRPVRPHNKRHAGRPLKGYGFGLRMGDWKYFEAKDEGLRELYDLRSDPQELNNLADERVDLADQYSAVIAHFMLSMGGNPDNIDTTLDPEFIDSLRRLGYLGEDEE